MSGILRTISEGEKPPLKYIQVHDIPVDTTFAGISVDNTTRLVTILINQLETTYHTRR